jgi:CubicO group peptidase (beta-lactamase class C family)
MSRFLAAGISCFVWVSGLGAQALDTSVLDSLIRQCVRTNSNALLIYRGDTLVYENYFGTPRQRIEAMSSTKSIVSLGVGILLDKGFIDSLDQPVHTLYPEWRQGNKQGITIRHLLDHTAGLQNVPDAGQEVEVAPDVIQLALCAELDGMPGERFVYNNKSSNLLAGVIERASGMKMDKFIGRYLFRPLGIRDYAWRTDARGNPLGMAGLQIHPGDLARIGLLLLNRGKWKGRTVISEAWIEQLQQPARGNANYALSWWLTYDREYIAVDADFLSSIRDMADAPALALLHKLEGRYDDLQQVRMSALEVYAAEELRLVGGLLQRIPIDRWRRVYEGGVQSYAASGYLGQYLTVNPGKDLVAVRMISAENFRAVPNNSSFEHFRRLVNSL